MSKAPILMSLFFLFSVAAEAAHSHKAGTEASCPAVCLGASSRTYCDNTISRLPVPEVSERLPVTEFASYFVPQVFEDEIFHPPLD